MHALPALTHACGCSRMASSQHTAKQWSCLCVPPDGNAANDAAMPRHSSSLHPDVRSLCFVKERDSRTVCASFKLR